MADSTNSRGVRMRQARKSIAHLPPSDVTGEKENATLDSSSLGAMTAKINQNAKKSRSKSLGPGGLDPLKEGSGNQGRPSLPHLKSILKPTMPVSPSKASPKAKNASASPRKSPGRKTPDPSPKRSPQKSPQRSPVKSQPVNAEGLVENGSGSAQSNELSSKSPERVALRTEEQQQTAAKEKERSEIEARKEARRKSLASRRVSFAPEATLHTWNVVEMPEDSTTSSASTNSTRRASGMTQDQGSLFNDPSPSSPFDGSEPPSTPPEQIEDVQVNRSPAHQRDAHQKKRRRSSTMPQRDYDEATDMSSSPFSGDSEDETGTQAFETADEGSDSSDSDGPDHVEEETVNGVEEDNTFHSADSTNSSGRLEAALQQAAKQAGTRGIDFDENGDLTMEMADNEVTDAFQPWVAQSQPSQPVGDASALLDQENINPFSPAFKANLVQQTEEEAEDQTMDMTQAVGGIIQSKKPSPKNKRRKSVINPNRRRSSVARCRSSGDESVFDGDQTMDLTVAIGGIQNGEGAQANDTTDDAEDLTMEFTSVVGGVMTQSDSNVISQDLNKDSRRDSVTSTIDDETMEFTQGVGGILLPSITERTEPDEDQTMDMNVTEAIGSILPKQLAPSDKGKAKALLELEVNNDKLPTASPFHDGSPQKVKGAGLLDERPLPTQNQDLGGDPFLSPARVQRKTPDGKGNASGKSPTPKSRQSTPIKRPTTPSKQSTPKNARPLTPGKTPPPKNVTMRSASPKKLFETQLSSAKKQETASTPPPPGSVDSTTASPKKLFEAEVGSRKETLNSTPQSKPHQALFHHDPVTGAATPSIVLKPQRRRSSGFGIDRDGLGSPRVSKLLDRRSSIGDTAKAFAPKGAAVSGVRFQDPRILDQEIEADRAQDLRRESGLVKLQQEADEQDLESGKDATSNLKGMIESLSPVKNKIKGRKSLHVGAAKGLLGKRPVELDDDEEEDASPKRLNGREGSPVKKIKLPAPPSQAATTGRATRSSKLKLAESSGNARPNTPSGGNATPKTNTTPKNQSRFKDVEASSPAKIASFDRKLDGEGGAQMPLEDAEQLQLHEFLQVTGIRFMDQLTTTKRRHTQAPANMELDLDKTLSNGSDFQPSSSVDTFESCVVAGACTVPMLELYQHSCRELKSYISEGRKVAKEIETATYEDNPPLFREYMSAPADVKSIMDTQFKNVKMNARHLSKAMWYEWRMKLLEGLREGLVSIGNGMQGDAEKLTQQEQIIAPVLPGLEAEHDKLKYLVEQARAQADELAQCDQEELKESRQQLVGLDDDLRAKRQMVEDLQGELRECEDSLESVVDQKQECTSAIQEAERIRQECRGWSTNEVASLQGKIRVLEDEYGWMISSSSSESLSMVYNRSIQLRLLPSAFQTRGSKDQAATTDNDPISLTYIADADDHHPRPLTTEKRFFLQIIRARLQCIHQRQTSLKDVLQFVSSGWDLAIAISEESRRLGVSFLSEPMIKGDEIMAVSAVLFFKAMQTKVEASFEVKVGSGEGVGKLAVAVKPSVQVCYGESLNEKKMSEFLESRVKGVEGFGVWTNATRDLEEKLLARGKKGGK